ncbi:multicomponent Na+:H+ antiporter subunit E [Rhodoligotrophos appendicifer]|uniref:Na+/H+ antiporter subunit E n=1 Tax=Rhodoligotrophos appendicifer TaxID=987056 RepID=UPI0011853B24|nr:Na+/H+ antiporter subunit E [Rhodoligotrophos appendicifer]
MKTLLPTNMALAFLWAAITANFSVINIVFGFVLGLLALWMVREQLASESYFTRLGHFLRLGFIFLRELTLSTWSVAKLAWTPTPQYRPAFIAYPLKVQSSAEITLLANLITLTPGTLSVDVSNDRSTLYIHALDVPDIEALRASIADSFERRIEEALR